MKRMKDLKKYAVPAAFAAGSILLYLILTLAVPPSGPVSPEGEIRRDGYGGDEQQYQILVDGLGEGDESIPLDITVRARQYTEKEAEQVFADVMDQMEERIRGQNPSLMEVSTDLNLPSWLDETGISLRWYTSDPERIDGQGKVKNTDLAVGWPGTEAGMESADSAAMVTLYVQLSDGIHQADYEIPVRLVPPQLTGQQQLLEQLRAKIQGLDEEQKEAASLTLPREYEGRPLTYHTKEESDYVLLPVLGILMAVIWPAREEAERRKKQKSREQELLLDYAELVSKLMVLIGAGMTVRNAWARIVRDYETGLEKGTGRKRAVYEEMRQTHYQLQNGMSESRAYRDFGSRCRLQPYLKLSGLLEQNLKSGTKNLRIILNTELSDAFEMRKNLALRMGEEAGTRLLMPLFLMLGIVMVMIMVPAMMTMG